VIASLAFFVLDAILDWPVTLYDGSWSQWGQLSGSAANGGTLRSDSIWRTDTPARSGLYIYNFATDSGPVFYTAGTVSDPHNDMTASGIFTGTTNSSFRIQIDSAVTGTANTFSWSSDGTTNWAGNTGILITGGTQTLSGGMMVTFASATGHNLNDRWDFITKRPVELLSGDGGSCSSRRNLNGTPDTLDPLGCMPTPPESQAATANQIEEADAAYMAGGGGGGGGVGPIAPGY
jgi:hypothetical protein